MSAQCQDDHAQLHADAANIRVEECAEPVIDPRDFKHALGTFATGVTLATTAAGEEWHGVTANAVMSVSLDPPLVLLSIQQGSRMHAVLRNSDNFALSVLSAAQEAPALYFASSSVPHDAAAFAAFPHHLGETGAPILDGALAAVDCRIVQTVPAGDHVLYLGHVVYLEVGERAEPLLYYRGALG